MKINKQKIPFAPQVFKTNRKPDPSEVKMLENLIKEDRIKEFEDYINKQLIGAELDTSLPGVPTRDYLASALSSSIMTRYPEVKNMSPEHTFKFLKDKVYPGLNELKKQFNLSNEVEIKPYNEDSYAPIGKKNQGKIKLDSAQGNFVDSALHELAHSVDDPINNIKSAMRYGGDKTNIDAKKQALSEFINKNPKIKKLVDSDTRHTTDTEGLTRYKNIARSPNFEDYDWTSGEFGSDIIQNPIDKYKEVGGEHHIDRPFSLDNFINFSKGDLKDIVKNEQDPSRFSKIKKLIG